MRFFQSLCHQINHFGFLLAFLASLGLGLTISPQAQALGNAPAVQANEEEADEEEAQVPEADLEVLAIQNLRVNDIDEDTKEFSVDVRVKNNGPSGGVGKLEVTFMGSPNNVNVNRTGRAHADINLANGATRTISVNLGRASRPHYGSTTNASVYAAFWSYDNNPRETRVHNNYKTFTQLEHWEDPDASDADMHVSMVRFVTPPREGSATRVSIRAVNNGPDLIGQATFRLRLLKGANEEEVWSRSRTYRNWNPRQYKTFFSRLSRNAVSEPAVYKLVGTVEFSGASTDMTDPNLDNNRGHATHTIEVPQPERIIQHRGIFFDNRTINIGSRINFKVKVMNMDHRRRFDPVEKLIVETTISKPGMPTWRSRQRNITLASWQEREIDYTYTFNSTGRYTIRSTVSVDGDASVIHPRHRTKRTTVNGIHQADLQVTNIEFQNGAPVFGNNQATVTFRNNGPARVPTAGLNFTYGPPSRTIPVTVRNLNPGQSQTYVFRDININLDGWYDFSARIEATGRDRAEDPSRRNNSYAYPRQLIQEPEPEPEPQAQQEDGNGQNLESAGRSQIDLVIEKVHKPRFKADRSGYVPVTIVNRGPDGTIGYTVDVSYTGPNGRGESSGEADLVFEEGADKTRGYVRVPIPAWGSNGRYTFRVGVTPAASEDDTNVLNNNNHRNAAVIHSTPQMAGSIRNNHVDLEILRVYPIDTFHLGQQNRVAVEIVNHGPAHPSAIALQLETRYDDFTEVSSVESRTYNNLANLLRVDDQPQTFIINAPDLEEKEDVVFKATVLAVGEGQTDAQNSNNTKFSEIYNLAPYLHAQKFVIDIPEYYGGDQEDHPDYNGAREDRLSRQATLTTHVVNGGYQNKDYQIAIYKGSSPNVANQEQVFLANDQSLRAGGSDQHESTFWLSGGDYVTARVTEIGGTMHFYKARLVGTTLVPEHDIRRDQADAPQGQDNEANNAADPEEAEDPVNEDNHHQPEEQQHHQEQDQPQEHAQEAPANQADLEQAIAEWTNNVWPIFQQERCVTCHSFSNADGTPGNGIANTHAMVFRDPDTEELATPLPAPGEHENIIAPNRCTGCHTEEAAGFLGWRNAPPSMRWDGTEDAAAMRQRIIEIALSGVLHAPNLREHLVGNDPFIQWTFIDGLPGGVRGGGLPAGRSRSDRQLIQITDENGSRRPMTWQEWTNIIDRWLNLEPDARLR